MLTVVVCLALFAQAREAPAASAPSKPLSFAPGRRECARGVELRLSAPVSSQGSLLLVELRSAKTLKEVKAHWAGQEAPFWKVDGKEKRREDEKAETGHDVRMAPRKHGRKDVWRALLGVDLEQAAGNYDVTVFAQSEGGEQVSCGLIVVVKARRFATERLRVAPKFVEPSPDEAKRALEERERLRAIFAAVTPERLWEGRFRVPLDGAAPGGNFGKRRILNGHPGSPHSGMDFPAAAGTPVRAAQSGRVALAEELFFSGNTVVVDHGLGIYTFYGHLSSMRVKAGEAVEAGGVLGEVGATGRVTGPHLHWGLTVRRARVNPLQIVTLLGKAGSATGGRRE